MSTTTPSHTTTEPAATPEQLTLLSPRELPPRFRLDQRTRQRGLAHIAQLRAQLAHRTAGQSEQAA
jgi:hypothetical protein